jgi:uncharacterized protein (DUF952 family)
MLIYKILLPAEWSRLQADGQLDGSPFDHSSGFIHFSGRDQLAGTAARFFADDPELVVLAVEADGFGDALRWETASDGGSFPHLYGTLPRTAVVEVHHVAGAAAVEHTLAEGD